MSGVVSDGKWRLSRDGVAVVSDVTLTRPNGEKVKIQRSIARADIHECRLADMLLIAESKELLACLVALVDHDFCLFGANADTRDPESLYRKVMAARELIEPLRGLADKPEADGSGS